MFGANGGLEAVDGLAIPDRVLIRRNQPWPSRNSLGTNSQRRRPGATNGSRATTTIKQTRSFRIFPHDGKPYEP